MTAWGPKLGHCSDVRRTTALPPKAEVHPRILAMPEGSVILSLSLGGVGKLIRAPRPKVAAAERQVQLAHSPIRARAYGISAAHGGVGSSSPGPLSPEYRSIHSSRLSSLGTSA
jgi:hypothetical protein